MRPWLLSCAPDAVTWEGWQAIDEHERAAGEPHGRPRVKLVRLADLVAAGAWRPRRRLISERAGRRPGAPGSSR